MLTASLGWMFTSQMSVIPHFRQSTLASAHGWHTSESDQQKTGWLRGRPGWPCSRVCVTRDQRPVCVWPHQPLAESFCLQDFFWTIQNFSSRYLASSCCMPMGQTPSIIPSRFKQPVLSGERLCGPKFPVEKTEVQWDEETRPWSNSLDWEETWSQSCAHSTYSCISIAYVAFTEHLLCAACFTGLKCHSNSVRNIPLSSHQTRGDGASPLTQVKCMDGRWPSRVHSHVETWIPSGVEICLPC